VRDYALILALLVGLGITFPFPFVGVLLWTWLGVMNPHMETYGLAREIPLNFIVALVTVVAWLLAKERKIPPNDFILWMIFAFLVWVTFNSFFAVDPSWSWPLWDRTWKIFALGIMVAVTATTKARIHSLVWIVVISLFYYGVKGGIFTLTSGGVYHVYGPESTIIGDNNQLATALLMALPLAN
jgi:probable O-glycosylation ligase (exosortase A-associated)